MTETPRLRVVVAVCSTGRWHIRTSACMVMMGQVFEHAEFDGTKELDILPVYGEVFPELRQRAVTEAVARDATHILWVGPNMLFPPDALNWLLKFNLPVLGANYTENKDVTSARPTAYVDSDEYVGPLYTERDSEGVAEVAHCGLGFMLTDIRIYGEEVFPDLPWFQYEPQPPANLQFADDAAFFCRKLREAGVPIVVSHELSKDVHQIGDHVYTVEDACRLRGFNTKRVDAWAETEKERLIGPKDEMVQQFMAQNLAERMN